MLLHISETYGSLYMGSRMDEMVRPWRGMENVKGWSMPWSRMHKDIAQRQVTDALAAHFSAWYGQGLPAIAEVLPTDLPAVHVTDRRVDRLFRLVDGSLLDLEFQTAADPVVDRFLDYAVDLWHRYHSPLQTVVLHLGPPPAPPLPSRIEGGWLQFQLERTFVGARDGAATWQRLQAKQASGPAADWTGVDVLDVALLPYMRDPAATAAARVGRAIQVAAAMPSPWAEAAVACVVGMAPAELAVLVLKWLQEVRSVRSVLDVVVEEAEQRGEARGEQRGEARGKVEGLQAAVRQTLLQRFGHASRATRTQVAAIDDADQLLALLDAVVSATSLADATHAVELAVGPLV